MPHPLDDRRPRLAYPFTVLTAANTVRLVAGEDHRYTLTAPELDRWLPAILAQLHGKQTVRDLLTPLSPPLRETALQVLGQLYGERVLVDGSAFDAHAARKYDIVIEGSGELSDLLPSPLRGRGAGGEGATPQSVDDAPRASPRLSWSTPVGPPPHPRPLSPGGERGEYWCSVRTASTTKKLSPASATAAPNAAFLWATTGPLNRGYVSPLFLPDAGPCLGCLFGSFQRLSPAPEIYDALREHARQGKPIELVEFPREGLLILQGIIAWKLREAERDNASPGLYRLHVLDRERFEVSTHRVFVDPHCPICGKEPR